MEELHRKAEIMHLLYYFRVFDWFQEGDCEEIRKIEFDLLCCRTSADVQMDSFQLLKSFF